MRFVFSSIFCATLVLTLGSACSRNTKAPATVVLASLKDVPVSRLNYRYEADVPTPDVNGVSKGQGELNVAVADDFAANRKNEALTNTIVSPDAQRIVAVYRREDDVDGAFRIDMYSADGKFLRQITSENLSVSFPEKISWAPDGSIVAFAGATRKTQAASGAPSTSGSGSAGADVEPAPTPRISGTGEPQDVLTFETEQIYTCSAEGKELRLITQSEGKIYFHFTWSPDSLSLAALAATLREWKFMQYQSDMKGEVFLPKGRPRIVERNGRERLLDDNLTSILPSWSPDSRKLAVAYDSEVRLFDSSMDIATQSAVPLRNQLLISSYEFDQAKKESDSGTNSGIQSSPTPLTTLPDEKDLISFQPIIEIGWQTETTIYFQTGFVKESKTGGATRSSMRWHRIILSAQPVPVSK